jgi:hypothetical protein
MLFVRDFVKTTYDIDLKVHQYIFGLSYGLTQHLEISAALPFSNVRMSVVARATIVPNSFAPQPPYVVDRFNFFVPQIAQAAPPPTITVPNCPVAPCFDAVFSDSRSVTGLGDVIVRAKYQFYSGERVGWAAGLDARLPPGMKRTSSAPGLWASSHFWFFPTRAGSHPMPP